MLFIAFRICHKQKIIIIQEDILSENQNKVPTNCKTKKLPNMSANNHKTSPKVIPPNSPNREKKKKKNISWSPGLSQHENFQSTSRSLRLSFQTNHFSSPRELHVLLGEATTPVAMVWFFLCFGFWFGFWFLVFVVWFLVFVVWFLVCFASLSGCNDFFFDCLLV